MIICKEICKNCQNKHHTALCLSDEEVKKEIKPAKLVVESDVTHVTHTPVGILPPGPVSLIPYNAELFCISYGDQEVFFNLKSS